LFRDGCDHRDCAVGGYGQRAVDCVSARDLGHALDVLEVDHLADVGELEPQRVGIAVDGDDPQPELLGARDRPPLVAAGADEEDGLAAHARGRAYLRGASASVSRCTTESMSVSSPPARRIATPLTTSEAKRASSTGPMSARSTPACCCSSNHERMGSRRCSVAASSRWTKSSSWWSRTSVSIITASHSRLSAAI